MNAPERKAARGQPLVGLLNARTASEARFVPWRGPYRVPENAEIVINATSVGLHPVDGMPDIDPGSLRPGLVVADVIPNPRRTRLIAEAERRGCTTLTGLGMLVNQGGIAIKYWTGLDVEARVMRETIERIFGAG